MRIVIVFFTAVVLCTSLTNGAEPAEEKKKEPAENRLDAKVMALNLAAIPLTDVMELLESLTGPNVCLDRAAFDAAGVELSAKRITLNTKDGATLRDVLKAVAAQIGVDGNAGAVTVCGDVIAVTTEKGEKPFVKRHHAAIERAKKPDAKKLRSTLPEATFKDVGLSDTVDFLRDVSNVRIDVDWKKLEDAGVDRNHPINVRCRNLTFAQAIQLVIDSAGATKPIGWTFDGKTVSITQTPKEKDNWPPQDKKKSEKKEGL